MNNNLTSEEIAAIEKDSAEYVNKIFLFDWRDTLHEDEIFDDYKAGAISERQKAKVLLEALESMVKWFSNYGISTMHDAAITKAKQAIENYNKL